jgi:cbb3-type cytochrome oxidase subunit 3
VRRTDVILSVGTVALILVSAGVVAVTYGKHRRVRRVGVGAPP